MKIFAKTYDQFTVRSVKVTGLTSLIMLSSSVLPSILVIALIISSGDPVNFIKKAAYLIILTGIQFLLSISIFILQVRSETFKFNKCTGRLTILRKALLGSKELNFSLREIEIIRRNRMVIQSLVTPNSSVKYKHIYIVQLILANGKSIVFMHTLFSKWFSGSYDEYRYNTLETLFKEISKFLDIPYEIDPHDINDKNYLMSTIYLMRMRHDAVNGDFL